MPRPHLRARRAVGARALWPMVLVLAVAMVASDFVRHPFQGAQPGRASAGPRDLTLWTAGTDAKRTPARLAQALARRLDGPAGHVRADAVPGGSVAALLALLGPDAPDGALVVVHAGTFADLAVQRDDAGIPNAPAEARRASRLLAAATPVAVLADDTLLLAADRRGGVPSAASLVATMRRAPERVVVGIGSDAWSKTALATLVEAAGAAGHVPYRVLPAARDAGAALGPDGVDVLLAPASELRGLAPRVRPLAQSDGGPRLGADAAPLPAGAAAGAAPLPSLGSLLHRRTPIDRAHRWIALVAPPSLRGAARASVAARVDAATATPAWRRALRQAGLGAPPPADAARVLARGRAEAELMRSAAARVEEATVAPRRPRPAAARQRSK